MQTSCVPRFLISESTRAQNFAPSLSVAVLAGPQPEDVAGALHRHRQRDVDRAVRDIAVADLHVYGVDEDHRVHRIQGAGLPFGHALDHPVGDRGDRLRQRRLTGLDDLVISLSAKGLTHGEICAHLAEVYGASVSRPALLHIPRREDKPAPPHRDTPFSHEPADSPSAGSRQMSSR
jgi:hypothetical protein